MFIPISPDPPKGQNNNSSFNYLIRLEILINPLIVISLSFISLVFIDSLNKSEKPPVITSLNDLFVSYLIKLTILSIKPA